MENRHKPITMEQLADVEIVCLSLALVECKSFETEMKKKTKPMNIIFVGI